LYRTYSKGVIIPSALLIPRSKEAGVLVMSSFESSIFYKSLFSKRRDCDYSPHLKNVVIDTKSVNCEVTSRLLSISTCYSRRPGSLQADAFRGHGFSLLEKTTLRGLQTRAIPAGVTALHLPVLVRLTEKICY